MPSSIVARESRGEGGVLMAAAAELYLLVVALSHLPLIWSSDPLLSPKGVNYEVAALMSVKSKIRGAAAAMNGWDINSVDPCTWSMIGCSPDGYVISLEMASNGFTGTLSPSIGNLSHLQTMLLQNNGLSGPIPPEIGKLAQLRTLDLSGNQFTGQIPPSLGFLINLNYLRLNGNNLTGHIPEPVAALSGLSFLDLSFNNLSGPIPVILAKDYSVAGNKFLCTPSVLQGCVEAPVPAKETDESAKGGGDHELAVAVGVSVGSAAAVSLAALVCWMRWSRCRAALGVAEEEYEMEIGHVRRFTLKELVMATNSFDADNVVGQGGFGVVYRGVLRNGTAVAVKRLKDPNSTGEVQFQTEVEMIGLALHRNLLRLYGFCMTDNERLLVYPFMPNGSVADHLRRERAGEGPRLEWRRRMKIALGAARGLLYLHEQCNPKIIHRDVKAANVLLDHAFEAVVGDFGLAKLLDRHDSHVTTAVRGTAGHIAPEYLATGQSSDKTDVFGFGILLLELVTAAHRRPHKAIFLDWVRAAYAGKSLETLVDRDLENGDDVDPSELENAVRLGLLCTQSLPGLRPKMSEVVKVLEGGAAGAPGSSTGANLCEERSSSFSRNQELPLPHDESSFIIEPIELSGPRKWKEAAKLFVLLLRMRVVLSAREDCRRLLELSLLRGGNHLPRLSSQIHARLVTCGLQRDSFLCTKLISLYSLCGNPNAAEKILDGFEDGSHHRLNSFLLGAAIRGISGNGLHQRAVTLFCEKIMEGLVPDSSTFSCAAKACAASLDLRRGRPLHALSVTSGLCSDLFVCNSLVAMYAKCDSLRDAVELFDRMNHRDVVSWNSIISAFARHGLHQEALRKMKEMVVLPHGDLRPDQATLASALTACFFSEAIREIHGYATRSELLRGSAVQNALITAYARCGRVREAEIIFRRSVVLDAVSWNALISGYAMNDLFEESFLLLQEMETLGIPADVITYSGIISSLAQQGGRAEEALEAFRRLLRAGLAPDVVATASVLSAIADLRRDLQCREIHGFSVRKALESDRRVANALVSAYGKCGIAGAARSIFEEMGSRDVISWSSMVAGFAQNGRCREALELFAEMIMAEEEPSPLSITSVLAACAGVSGLRQGREVHLWAAKKSLDTQTFIGSALIDMYAKCGRIGDARKIFDRMPDRNLVTWNAMIGGYAFHGMGEEALSIFRSVEDPDEVSFIAALSACSHGGLVEQGVEIFSAMERLHVSPKEGHYACMVDILGRSGRLGRAIELVQAMPAEPTASIWGSLLGACRLHCNLSLGVFSGAQIVGHGENQSSSSGYYVTVSNLLAEAGLREEAEAARKAMSVRGMKKDAACSWIEVNKQVHAFVSKDRDQHPSWGSLRRALLYLHEQMKCT